MSGFKTTKEKGFHITFENGWTVSVQFGWGNYCDNYDAPRGCKPPECRNAEIAAWNKNDIWHQFDSGDEVEGPASPAEVLEFMNLIAAKELVK